MVKTDDQNPLLDADNPTKKDRKTNTTKREMMPKRKLTKILKIGGTICVIATTFIIVWALTSGNKISAIVNFTNRKILTSSSLALDNVKYNKPDNTLVFIDENLKNSYLTIEFSNKFITGEVVTPSECQLPSAEENLNPNVEFPNKCPPQLKLHFDNGLFAVVHKTDLDRGQCHSVHWYADSKDLEVENCVKLIDNWYGGGGLTLQRWPLNRARVSQQPHLTRKLDADKTLSNTHNAYLDSFIEPYFVSASGVAILVKHYLPLFISVNDPLEKTLCIKSAFKNPYTFKKSSTDPLLSYLVCKDLTAKAVHSHLLKNAKIPYFRGNPNIDILQKPIWSTRGLFTSNYNERMLLSFINNIKSNHLPHGFLSIDGNYSKSSGNFYFKESMFPHSHQLIMELNSPGEDRLPVGTEVFPHVPSQHSTSFAVQRTNNSAKLLDPPQINYLDVTNEEALKYYKMHLKEVAEQIQLKGFRFSGGQAMDFLNGHEMSSLLTNTTLQHPNEFTKKYAEVASQIGRASIIGSGYESQAQTFVADAGPMVSSWDHNKGLKSIIPTVLTYGIMGYPFVLAGPIGGVNKESDATLNMRRAPDKDLYVRWLQLATYLPVMELSFGPWVYGEEVVNYTQSLLSYRKNDLWPKVIQALVADAVEYGTPIARPLWWIAPDDPTAQFIDCEFFLGNSLLVAPVLYPDARARDVYLPQGGWWRDLLRGDVHEGGQWLRSYRVELFEIATFRREAKPHTSL